MVVDVAPVLAELGELPATLLALPHQVLFDPALLPVSGFLHVSPEQSLLIKLLSTHVTPARTHPINTQTPEQGSVGSMPTGAPLYDVYRDYMNVNHSPGRNVCGFPRFLKQRSNEPRRSTFLSKVHLEAKLFRAMFHQASQFRNLNTNSHSVCKGAEKRRVVGSSPGVD